MEYTVFRNVGTKNSDPGDSPTRKNTIFRTRRKFETKNKCRFLPHAILTDWILITDMYSFLFWCINWTFKQRNLPTSESQGTDIFSRCKQIPFQKGAWSLDPWDSKRFPLKTGFSYAPRFPLRQVSLYIIKNERQSSIASTWSVYGQPDSNAKWLLRSSSQYWRKWRPLKKAELKYHYCLYAK